MKKIILYFGLAVILQFSPAFSKVEHVNIDPKIFSLNNGNLNEATAVIFLNKAYQQNFLNQNNQHFPNPQCLKAKDLGITGANTLKLFAIQASQACSRDGNPSQNDYRTLYILKEMGKGMTEAKNLEALKNSELSNLEMSKVKEEGLPSLAFHHQLLDYQDSNKKTHILTLLYAAQGQEIKSQVNQFAVHQRGKKTDSAEYIKMKEKMYQTFYVSGKAMGKMHYKYMEPAGAIFGMTHVHADLHMENIFVDGNKVTFIDNETFVISLKEKQPISVDVMRFILFTVVHPDQHYRHPKDIPSNIWCQIAVLPFFRGYIEGYPADKQAQVTQKLKRMLLDVTPSELVAIWRNGSVDGKMLEEIKKDYIKPIFGN